MSVGQAQAIAYAGVMDGRHLRAALRVALRARGFQCERERFLCEAREQLALGTRLRDRTLPAALPGFAGADCMTAVAGEDPFLWQRLPLMAALGHRQTEALHALAGAPAARMPATATLGATFNTAIATLDYAVDERFDARRVLEPLQGPAVAGIFGEGNDSARALAHAYAAAGSPTERLVYALVGSCAEQGRLLHRAGETDLAWAELGMLVATMLDAERALADDPSLPAERRLAELEAKSSGPTTAMYLIATLAAGPGAAVDGDSRAAVAALGSIFLRVDDAVDLLDDCRRGTPNLFAARLPPGAADADVYRVLEQAAIELERDLEQVRARGGHALWRLARLVIAAWAGWHEDEAPRLLGSAPLAGAERAAAERALGMLLGARENEYSEAVHHLRFPRIAEQGIRYETHPALVSFRAVGLEALLDCFESGLAVPEAALNAEALALLRAKHPHVRGGWSYFHTVAELPPDADDLGQVLQGLARLGGEALAASADEAVRLVLDGAGPDGSFDTWILDPRGSSAVDRKIRDFLWVMGGHGAHPDVIANLLYGLVLYSPRRYAGALRRGAGYLESVQDPEGSWQSKWYAGPFYGTYRAVWLIGCVSPGSGSLARAREFLLACQHEDGGWGEEGSDPLSTALAVLALGGPSMERPAAAIERGIELLVATQEQDGGWRAVPWIAFPTTDTPVAHGSRTMTTAFCVRALVAARGHRSPRALSPALA